MSVEYTCESFVHADLRRSADGSDSDSSNEENLANELMDDYLTGVPLYNYKHVGLWNCFSQKFDGFFQGRISQKNMQDSLHDLQSAEETSLVYMQYGMHACLRFLFFFFLGRADLLHKIARAGRSRTNACKNLRRLLNSSGRLLPVSIDCIEVMIKVKKPKVRRVCVWWPILRMKDFIIRTLFQKCPQALLAGHDLQGEGWKTTLKTFWGAYKNIDGDHPFFSSTYPWECSIPYYFHGDEGRTLRSKAVMIISWQPTIPYNGLGELNEKGFPGFAKATCFPKKIFALKIS